MFSQRRSLKAAHISEVRKINVYAVSFISRASFCFAIFQVMATWEETTCKARVRRSWKLFLESCNVKGCAGGREGG
jgi:hypothetical protein